MEPGGTDWIRFKTSITEGWIRSGIRHDPWGIDWIRVETRIPPRGMDWLRNRRGMYFYEDKFSGGTDWIWDKIRQVSWRHIIRVKISILEGGTRSEIRQVSWRHVIRVKISILEGRIRSRLRQIFWRYVFRVKISILEGGIRSGLRQDHEDMLSELR